jgi:hypothetical protein
MEDDTMTERERKRRAEQSRRDRQASYTIAEWCDRRRLSLAMFYKLDQQNLAPRSYYVGRKRCISDEADAEWLAAREAETERTAA